MGSAFLRAVLRPSLQESGVADTFKQGHKDQRLLSAEWRDGLASIAPAVSAGERGKDGRGFVFNFDGHN